MRYLTIDDDLGNPIEIDERGLYFRFAEIEYPDDKARFMREYRLLPCDRVSKKSLDHLRGKHDVFICDDASEFDMIRAVMDDCARLAAFGYGYGTGTRKPEYGDLEHINGLEFVEGGAFLRLDLSKSYWYKRFLYDALKHNFTLGDSVSAPIENLCLIDNEQLIGNGEHRSWIDEQIERMTLDSGSFEYSSSLDEQTLKKLDENDDGTLFACMPSMLNDITRRRGFLQFAPVPNLRFKGRLTFTSDEKAAFWTDNKLVIRAEGDNPEEQTRLLSEYLALIHTNCVWHHFSFHSGFYISAPIGISALWADFVQCVAKRPVTICEICGKPIVSDKTPRGQQRHTCSTACRKERSRRNKAAKEAAESKEV